MTQVDKDLNLEKRAANYAEKSPPSLKRLRNEL